MVAHPKAWYGDLRSPLAYALAASLISLRHTMPVPPPGLLWSNFSANNINLHVTSLVSRGSVVTTFLLFIMMVNAMVTAFLT
jgi:hypothetical protein